MSSIPSDWDLGRRLCDQCGTTYHASGTELCDCEAAEERWDLALIEGDELSQSPPLFAHRAKILGCPCDILDQGEHYILSFVRHCGRVRAIRTCIEHAGGRRC